MTTKFKDTTECIGIVAAALGQSFEDTNHDYEETNGPIRIGWPHDQEAVAFDSGGYSFVISDFRDGKTLWDFDRETGLMARI